jgi:hypothetical protein
MDIDRHIEAPDDDYEPRDICAECDRDVTNHDHADNCSLSPGYYDRPVREIEPDDIEFGCDGD